MGSEMCIRDRQDGALHLSHRGSRTVPGGDGCGEREACSGAGGQAGKCARRRCGDGSAGGMGVIS